jgi:hypothetical protein
LTFVSLLLIISANVETTKSGETKMIKNELEIQFRDVLYRLFSEMGVVGNVQIKMTDDNQGQYQPDMLITLNIGKREYQVAVEVKSIGQPRFIRMAAQQLNEYKVSNREIDYSILAAPYITEDGRQLCRQYNIGCIDLAGNARLKFNRLYVDIQGKENPHPTTRGIKSLFTKKSSRAMRVLLADSKKSWYVQDLAKEADLSLGQTSNIKRLLLDEDLVQQEGKSFKLTDPRRLLDAWSQIYSFKDNELIDFYAIEGTKIESKIASFCKESGIRYALALFSGANLVAPFVRYTRSFLYVEDRIPELTSRFELKEVTSGPNITLLKPYDEGVFYGAQEVNGLTVASNIQLYLDLKNYQGRGEEAAKYIMDNRLEPAWK